jgi:hypothetical protein
MIANIPSGTTNIRAIVYYHEKKLNSGQAKVLDGNTLSRSSHGFISQMNNVANLNPNVYKNKFYNIDLNFPQQDNEHLSDDMVLQISKDYMEQMNLSNCPYRIYRHYDRNHQHIHIVASSINFDGHQDFKNERYLYKRNKELCRNLEKKYGLFYVKNNTRKKVKYSLSELNMDKYSFQKALKKGLNSNTITSQLSGYFNINYLQNTLKESYTNEKLYNKLGDKQYNKLYEILDKNRMFNTHYKLTLMKKLDRILKHSKNIAEYQNLCQQNNIYIRHLTYNNQHYFKYILKEGNINFEVKDTTLSARFRYPNLENRFSTEKTQTKQQQKVIDDKRNTQFNYNQTTTNQTNKEKTFTKDNQKAFLKRTISRAIDESVNFSELKENLAKRDIHFNFVKKKNGEIQGIQFYQNSKHSEIFKGSDIHRNFSYVNITKTLENNLNSHIQSKKQSLPETKYKSYKFQNHHKNIILPDIQQQSKTSNKIAADADEEEKIEKLKNQNISDF